MLMPVIDAAAISVNGECIQGLHYGHGRNLTVALSPSNDPNRDVSDISLINDQDGSVIKSLQGDDKNTFVFENVPEGNWFVNCKYCCDGIPKESSAVSNAEPMSILNDIKNTKK